MGFPRWQATLRSSSPAFRHLRAGPSVIRRRSETYESHFENRSSDLHRVTDDLCSTEYDRRFVGAIFPLGRYHRQLSTSMLLVLFQPPHLRSVWDSKSDSMRRD